MIRRPAPWQPARLRRGDVLIITLAVWFTASSRGLDYATGDDSNIRGPKPGVEPALVGIEAAFPLVVWGIGILFAVTLLGVGIWKSWHFPVWAGHVILSAVYLALCVGLLPSYLHRDALDGIRGATGLLVPTVIHAVFWWRMGPRPIEVPRA